MGSKDIYKIITPNKAKYVDGKNVEKRITAAILKSIYLNLLEKNESGVLDCYYSIEPQEDNPSVVFADFTERDNVNISDMEQLEVFSLFNEPVFVPKADIGNIKTKVLMPYIEVVSNEICKTINASTIANTIFAIWESALSDEGALLMSLDEKPVDIDCVFKNGLFIGIKDSITSKSDKACAIPRDCLIRCSQMLGFPKSELTKGLFIGFMCSSFSCERSLNTFSRTKITNSIYGNGIVFQPYIKIGYRIIKSPDNAIISKSAYNPILEVRRLFFTSFLNNRIVQCAKDVPYRYFPSKGKFKCNKNECFVLYDVRALDDKNNDHVVDSFYVLSDVKFTTIHDFFLEMGSKKEKGHYKIGDIQYISNSNFNYINVITISDDGSITINSFKAN